MSAEAVKEAVGVESKTAVNANANPGDKAIPKLTTGGTAPTWEDLGGPTPENYKPDDDSAKVKTPGGTIKQVSDVVTNRKGKSSGSLPKDLKQFLQAYRNLNCRVIGKAMSYARPGDRFEILLSLRHSL